MPDEDERWPWPVWSWLDEEEEIPLIVPVIRRRPDDDRRSMQELLEV
jgi:hypothetical protein